MDTQEKQEMYSRIYEHGEQLKDIFSLDESVDAVKLCKSLRRLETNNFEWRIISITNQKVN